MVIWLLGISGSGKTTITQELKKHFDKDGVKSFIIDGDIVRDFYDNDLGYSKEDRVANIKRIMLSAYLLEQNGIIPIVANISPFEFLREFAREKFNNYFEVYLKRELKEIKNKDFVYKDSTDVVGVDMVFDEPTKPSLTLDTGTLSLDECVSKILKEIKL